MFILQFTEYIGIVLFEFMNVFFKISELYSSERSDLILAYNRLLVLQDIVLFSQYELNEPFVCNLTDSKDLPIEIVPAENLNQKSGIYIPQEGGTAWVYSPRGMSRGRSPRDIPRGE